MAESGENTITGPNYHDAGGFKVGPPPHPENVRKMLGYKHQENDVFVISFPRTGTNWMKQICYCIINNGESPGVGMLRKKMPFLELDGIEALETVPRPCVLTTHIRMDLLKNQLNPKSKYIIVLRNPKDTCVSLFHHTKGLPRLKYENGTFDHFFEIFIKGENQYGDYFDWLLPAIDRMNDENVLLLTYESVKRDTKNAVIKIARFLSTNEKDYGARLEKDKEYLDRILKHSSVEHMQTETNEAYKKILEAKDPEYKFIREGKANKWNETLNERQSELISQKFHETVKNNPILLKIWDDYSWLNVK